MLYFIKTNKSWIALFGLCLASFLGCIDFTIVNTALPIIQSQFHISIEQLQWITTAFLLALSVSMIIVGRLADQFGRKLLLLLGLLLFGISSLFAGLSESINLLIICRIIQGIGIAILYTIPIAIISDLFDKTQTRNKATGIMLGVNGIGLAAGPMIGGLILSIASWNWVFFVNVPIAIISILIGVFAIDKPASNINNKKIDWLGFLLILVSFPLLIIATNNGQKLGWGSLQVLSMYGAAALLIAYFIFHQLKTKQPMMNLKAMNNRNFILGSFGFAILAFYYNALFLILPLFLHKVDHAGGLTIGLTLLPCTLAVAILSPWVGKKVAAVGSLQFIIYGFICFIISGMGLWMSLDSNHFGTLSYIIMLVSLLFTGFGWVMLLTPSCIAAVASMPDKDAAIAMGTVGSFHNFGGCIGMAIAGIIMSNKYSSFTHNCQEVLTTLIGLSIASALIIYAFKASKIKA